MNRKRSVLTTLLAVAIATILVGPPARAGFYREPPLFNFTHANETLPKQSIEKFGPVGMSIDLKLPPFQMYVGKIEEGSPAETCGKLESGQKIESINGQVLKDIDPRIQLAQIITDAEAKDGLIKFKIADQGEVVVKIPVLGAYSDSWPLNCKKSDKIVRNLASYIRENGSYTIDTNGWASFDGFGALFLLSTGEKQDLNVVRGWMKENVEKLKGADKVQLRHWAHGPGALPLPEYYLRTGDKSVLPIIEKIADYCRCTIYNGGWSGRGKVVFLYAGNGGHMNAAGVHTATFLLLAKECGVKVDDYTLQASLRHLFRWAGKGNLSYGDTLPETYFINNGKTEALAFTMGAAASLTPKGEESVYAKARDVSAARALYDCNYMLVGHTGGGIGEAWRGPAMGLLYEKEPTMYRAFMDGRQWHLELSRRFNGSFTMLQEPGATRYSGINWGYMMGMQYTVPRKTLRMTGAKRTRRSKQYKLPVRPWGTAEDDDFYSTKPAEYADGTVPEFPQTLRDGTANGVERYVRAQKAAGNIDATIRKYFHHPDHEVRREICGFYRTAEQDHLIVPMLKHEDARVRRTALTALHHVHKGEHVLPPERLTDEMMEIVIKMVNDPEESWWVVENALRAMSLAPVEKTAPHIDRLLYWLAHDEWWLQHAAVYVLAPLAADDRYYERVMPKIGEFIVNNTHGPAVNSLRHVTEQMKTASAKVQAAGVQLFARAYAEFPETLQTPAGDDATPVMKHSMATYVVPGSLRLIAGHLQNVPGGYMQLLEAVGKRSPAEVKKYRDSMVYVNTTGFSDADMQKFKKLILEEAIPEYVAKNHGALKSESARTGGAVTPAVQGLAALYKKAGVEGHEWQDFGYDRSKMKWHYYNFDPPEKREYSPGGRRYRKITFPKGMEKWNSPEFDPVAAGWKEGLSPFGQDDGKLRTEQGGCIASHCRCGDVMNTFWDKEVLMIKGKFKFPVLKEGHSYRMLTGGAIHVGNTDGAVVYVNGRQVINATGGIGRGRGGRPRGVLLSKDLAAAFSGKEVDISAIAFMRLNKRSKKMGNFLTVFVQEMKNPPFTDEQAEKGKNLLSAAEAATK